MLIFELGLGFVVIYFIKILFIILREYSKVLVLNIWSILKEIFRKINLKI